MTFSIIFERWERFPKTREGQLVVTTFKKGKRDDPKNYRPVSLTLILGKKSWIESP